MARRIKPGHDLFGHPLPGTRPLTGDTDRMARRLRRLSEDAYDLGYGQSACLIELAANYVEMEAERINQVLNRR